MNCRDFEADIVELARCAPGEPGTAPELRRHLETCRACADRLARERALTGGLRSLAEGTEAPENPDTERRLLEAFASSRSSSGPVQPARMTTVWWMLAAASAILFVGSWTATRWPHGGGTRTITTTAHAPDGIGPGGEVRPPASVANLSTRPATASAATVSPVSSTSRTRDGLPRPPRPEAARRPTAPAADADELAGFVALPAADHFPGFDSGTIVRVALPAASLPAFGFPMTPDAARTVDADVLVGQDGQARAIRLVSLVTGPRREPR